ncbi:MAG TPA: HAD-IC family P-type ATPase, partial [Gillisia sp.]|nr:HAD-IC family P-type ATPase [Gillisia sp.]
TEGLDDPQKNANFSHIFKISVLANEASIEEVDNVAIEETAANDLERLNKNAGFQVSTRGGGKETIPGTSTPEDGKKAKTDIPKGTGDPLEIALLSFAHQLDSDIYEDHKKLERELHDPFDSETMVMGTISKEAEGHYVAGKGSTEAILSRSKKIQVGEEVRELTQEDRETWKKKDNELANSGLRVLGFAYKNTDTLPEGDEAEDFLYELTFVGLIGFIDPPLKEIAGAIEICKAAGIKVVMVTGDHPGTATNVGQQVNLIAEGKPEKAPVLHGKHLQAEFEKEDNQKLLDTRIFSRVDPGQKLQLIEHYQEEGEIVGMTGDGVNDAPALKKADIGIAMGKRGTQVAQEVSDIVLMDDAFGSILQAIEQGRIIFGNIRRFIIYQLSYHLAEIIIIAIISFGLFILPILPLQLLFLNLLSDVFPALALGIGEGSPKVMQMPPKDPKESIVTRKNWMQIGLYGLIIAVSVTGAYLYSHYIWEESEEINNNIAFFTLAFCQFLHVFNMREANEPMFNNQVTRNKFIWMALGLCFSVVMIFYFTPVLAEVLSFQRLSVREWGLILIAAFIPTLIMQLIKFLKRKSRRKN